MPALGLDWADVVEVVDELSGEVYQWGQRNAVGLDPHWRPAHILTIRDQLTSATTSTAPTRRVSMTYTDAHGTVHEPQASDYRTARPIAGGENDREWYKRAVFYEVLVRAFADSNGDGTGDLRGLIDKLDYLSWLGVDCLWLPPFYDSPLRDGGYDISDYRKVLPEFGNVEDFVALLDAAHERGIRVIVDLVMNHTSDAHQWFQESRRHPDGPYGDYYVWRDDDTGYPDARIIFVDTEPSNWTFDPVRKQYFWHRFFSHQPDLNFENPAVGDEMIDILRFWLDLGLDGFRLDAVPYLFEEEGTNGENLPKTHEFLKRCRKVLDVEYPQRHPAGRGQPVAGRRRRLLRRPGGRRRRMPHVLPLPADAAHFHGRPAGAAVPDLGDPGADAGDSGKRAVGHLPAQPRRAHPGNGQRRGSRLHVGRVRQGPADEGQHRHPPAAGHPAGERHQPAGTVHRHAAVSLPGSPVLYYGDEIGMGDNIWLGDRDGVRTPMQWSPDRNAGFSRCDPARLYLPAIMDPIYGFQTVNVEAQMNSTASLLHWTRRMIEIRKRYAAFSVGQFTDLGGSNPTVLSYTLHFDGDTGGIQQRQHTMLCVNNLSRFPQPVELDLRDHIGAVPIELTGAHAVPADRPTAVPADAAGSRFLLVRHHRPPGGDVSDEFRRRPRSRSRPTAGRVPAAPALVLGQGPGTRRASRSSAARTDRARTTTDADIEQVLFTVGTATGPQRYQIWIGWTWQVPDRLAHATIGSVEGRTAYDALSDVNVSRLLLEAIDQNRDFGDGMRGQAGGGRDASTPRAEGLVIGAEQSNTSIVYGHSAILKVFRRLEPGPNPDAEIHRALHAVGSTHIAQSLGELVGTVDGEETTLGLLTEFFANSAEGWAMATSSVRDLMSEGDLRADEVGGDFAAEAHRLGEAVAAVHADLARAFGTNIAPHDELTRILDGMRAEANAAADLVPSLAEHREAIMTAFDRASDHAAGINLQRIHGDLHLGQVLRTLTGWSIIDFEGEPSKPLAVPPGDAQPAQGRRRHAPLVRLRGPRPGDQPAHRRPAQVPGGRMGRAEPPGVLRRIRAPRRAPTPGSAGSLLRAFELDKAIYEVVYEHGHRPLWEAIPLQAVVALINTGGIS